MRRPDRELAEVSRHADNPALLGARPDLHVDVKELVAEVAGERDRR